MKRPAGRQTEGDLVLANGSVRLDRDTILPATNEKNFIAFCLYGVRFQNIVGAGPAIRDVSERNTAGVSIMRLGDTFNLPRYPSIRGLEQLAAHTHGREPDSLIVKEGRSGPVIFASEAIQPITSGVDRAGCILQENEYYHLDVAPLTNYSPEVVS